jgi:D-3-phosphoglycerate dehydrogenase
LESATRLHEAGIASNRGFIVDIQALVNAIKSGKVAGAAVDVFPKKPKSNDELFQTDLQNLPNVILTPHIGAGTEEAQKNIADFVSGRIMTFIDTGDTTLSVNVPNLQLPELKDYHRFIHIHHNVPGILAKINTILAENKINIEGQYLKTNDQIGYVITDVGADYDTSVIARLKKIPDTIKVRVLY